MCELTLLDKDEEHIPLGGSGKSSNKPTNTKMVDTMVAIGKSAGRLPKEPMGVFPNGTRVMTDYGSGTVVGHKRTMADGVLYDIELLGHSEPITVNGLSVHLQNN